MAMALTALLMGACATIPSGSPSPTLTPDAPSNLHTSTHHPSPSPSKPIVETLAAPNPVEPSPTPQPPKVSPTPTQQPTTAYTAPTRSSTSSPRFTSDLLFIADERLLRWDYITNYTSTLVEAVADFSVSASGKQLGLLRTRKMVPNGVEEFDLAVLNFDTKQITNLVEATSRLTISISPNGQWIAYNAKQDGGPIYAIPVDAYHDPIELGSCIRDVEPQCENISWSPDSRTVLWSDARGIWISSPEKASPSLVQANQVEVTDPKGEKMEITVAFNDFLWSPTGRYVLTKVIPSSSGVRWLGIVDTRRMRMADVPDSFEYDGSFASISWMKDGNLIVAGSSNSPGSQAPFLKIWQIVDTRDDLMILLKTFVLPPDDFPTAPLSEESEQTYYLNWLIQTDESVLAFGITFPDTDTAPILYNFDLEEEELHKMVELPHDSTGVLWAPDGGGALIIAGTDKVFFAPTIGGTLYNPLPILGPDAHNFIWLPPTSRS